MSPRRSSRHGIVLVLALLFGLLTPLLQDILREIRYAALTESSISQEIVLESGHFFENLETEDYLHLPAFFENHLEPLSRSFIRFLESVDRISQLSTAPQPTDPALHLLVSQLNQLHADTQNRIAGEPNTKFRSLLVAIQVAISDLSVSAARLNSPTLNTIERASEVSLLESKSYSLLVSFFKLTELLTSQYADRADLIAVQSLLITRLKTLRLENLIDLETPYFSMSPRFAEEKEREILSYLEIAHRDPAGVLALVNLYAEMRNIGDAVLLYREMISPLRLSNELQDVKRLIELKLRSHLRESSEASLLSAQLILEDSLDAHAKEIYEIINRQSEERVLIQLPYSLDSLALKSIKSQTGRDIEPIEVRKSWKNSTVIVLPWEPTLRRIELQYQTTGFAHFVKDRERYEFRYGGITSARQVSCELLLPPTVRVTGFEEQPDRVEVREGFTVFHWLNPHLPYRFATLRLLSHKTGIAGEFIRSRVMLERYFLGLGITALFLLCSTASQRLPVRPNVRESLYLLCSATAAVGMIALTAVQEAASSILLKVDPKALSIANAGLLVLIFLFHDRSYSGGRLATMTKACFDLALIGMVGKLVLQTLDLHNRFGSTLVLGVFLYVAYFIMRRVAEQTSFRMGTTFLLTAVCLGLGYVIWDVLADTRVSRGFLIGLGLVVGMLLLVLAAVFYVATVRTVVAKDRGKNFVDHWMEYLAVYLQGVGEDATTIVLIVLVVVSFYLESALLALVAIVAAGIFESLIDRGINRLAPGRKRAGRRSEDGRRG